MLTREQVERIYSAAPNTRIGVLAETEGEFVIVEDWSDMHKIVAALGVDTERHGEYTDIGDLVEYGFADEYDTCSNCGKIVRTSADSYFWEPDFWIDEKNGEILCSTCTVEFADDYVAALVDNPGMYKSSRIPVDLQAYGFDKHPEKYQSGWFDGMNDDPRKIAKKLRAEGYNVVFTASPSQFHTDFQVWTRIAWSRSKTWHLPGRYVLKILPATPTDLWDRIVCRYRFGDEMDIEDGMDPLFEGDDYSPSPLYKWDSKESAAALLGFLTLRRGDTDDDYFADYTEDQLEFSESFECEDIRTWVESVENPVSV